MLRHIQPGGYFEHCEFGITIINNDPGPQSAHADDMYKQYNELVHQASHMMGKSFQVDYVMPELMERAGTPFSPPFRSSKVQKFEDALWERHDADLVIA